MKSLFTTLFFLFCLCVQGFAQNTLEKAGGTSNDESMDVATDAAGNMYSCGYISNFVNFGSLTVDPPKGQSDIYVAKQSPTGTFLWVKRFAGTKDERAYDIYVDAAGMIYITGYFYGTTQFDSFSITSNNNTRDLFVAKLDNSGNVLWVKSEGGPDGDTGYGITTDSQGNVIVTGQFKQQITVGSSSYTTPNSPYTGLPTFDMIVIKYDANGNVLWSKVGTSDGDNRGLAVACNVNDEILVTGQFSDTFTLAGVLFNNQGYNLGLVAKFAPSGSLDWMRKLVASQVMAYDLAINSSKDIFVTGDFKGNGFTFIDNGGNHYLSSNYLYNIFLLRVDNTGSYVWGQTDGSHNEVSSQGVDLDNAENPYICGMFKCKMGEYSDALSSDSGYFYSMGYRDVFQTKYDSQGQRQWFRQYGGPKDDYCSGISISTPDVPVLSGSFERDFFAQFTSGFTTTDLSTFHFADPCAGFGTIYGLDASGNIDNKDIFVGRFNSVGLPHTSYFSPNCAQFLLPEIPNDTLQFCSLGKACVDDHANYYSTLYQPIFDYIWSNGDTTQCTQYLYSNINLTVNINREDHCYNTADTVVVLVHPNPPMPLLHDDHGVNNGSSPYLDVNLCYPDTASFWFTNIDTTCSYTWGGNGSYNINDTVTEHVTTDFGVTVTSPFGCVVTDDYWLKLITVDSPIVVKPFIRMIDTLDMNDSIRICNGVPVWFVMKDSLTTSGAYFDPFCTNYGYVDQHWTSSISMWDPDSIPSPPYCVRSYFYPSTTGWYTVKLDLIWGGMNQCGVDTIHQSVTDSFYIEVVPPPVITMANNSIVCPGDIGYSWVDTTFLGMGWWTWHSTSFTVLSGGDSIAINSEDSVIYSGNFLYQTDILCYQEVGKTIQFYDNPIITSNVPDNIICPNDSILLTCQAGLSYEWIGPQGQVIGTTQSVYASVPGYYHCNQTNFAGCLLPSNFIELKGYATPILTVSPDQFLCPGESATITVTTVGSPNFYWTNPVGYSSPDLVVTQPGTYICQITQCGFTVSDTAEIFDASFSIALNHTGDTTICFGDSVLVQTSPNYGNYLWSLNDNGNFYTFASQTGAYYVSATNEYGCTATSDTFNVLLNTGSANPHITSTTICAGEDGVFVYTDTNQVLWYRDSLGTDLVGMTDTLIVPQLYSDTTVYVLQHNGNCQSEIVPAHVHISTISNGISITGDTTICYGSTLSLVGSITGNSVWSGPNGFASTQDSIAISNATPANQNGYYYLTITEGNCQRKDSVFVNVFNALNTSLDTSGVLTICPGDSTAIGVVDTNYQIAWYPSGDTSSSITVFNVGTYYATLSDSLGCSATTDTVALAFYQNTAPILPDTMLCFGSNFSYNDASTYQLSWYDLDSNFIAYENLNLTNLLSDTSFLYEYLDTVTGCNPSMQVFTIHVLPPTPPTILGDTVFCAQVATMFSASYVSDGQSAWTIDGMNFANGDSCFLTIPQDTSFYLVLTTTGSMCSNGVDSMLVHAVLPVAPIVYDSIVQFCASTASEWVINNVNNDSVYWQTDVSQQTGGDTLNLVLNQNIVTGGSVYYVDSMGCYSNPTSFGVHQAVQASYNVIQAATTCVGDTIIVAGVSQQADSSYWITPNGVVHNDTIALYNAQVSNSGEYIFAVQDSNSCISRDTFQVQIAAPLVFDLGNDTTLCSGDHISISAPQSSNFTWSNGDSLQTQVVISTETLICTVWTGTYCPSSDTITVQVIECTPGVCNVVTANGDGVNDLFKIKNAEYLMDDYLIVTNRWGDVVYETYNYKNDLNPLLLNFAAGTYFYVYYETWKPKDPGPLHGFFEVYR